MRTSTAAARERKRDLDFANSATPPGVAEHSTVSPESLTSFRHDLLADGAVPAGQVVADDLEAQVRAASLPPGQIRALGNIGERPPTRGSRHQRGTGLDGR